MNLDILPFEESDLGFRPGAEARATTWLEKLFLSMVGIGGLVFCVSFLWPGSLGSSWGGWLMLGAAGLGSVGYFLVSYGRTTPGIKNHGVFHNGAFNRGAVGWLLGIIFTAFYVMLYWHPSSLEGPIRLMDPLSALLAGQPADQWFLYGSFYTFAVLVMGVRMLMKYRHNNYQIVRTLSVSFFQLGFGFAIPNLLKKMHQPDFYFTYFWPLKPDYLLPFDYVMGVESSILAAEVSGFSLGRFMIIWGALMTFVATPVLTYFFGKRWYCSWVCGCGGLAETLGDPWRQLSDNSDKSWRIERWSIHLVLVSIVLLTGFMWMNEMSGRAWLGNDGSGLFWKSYGFLIVMAFSGVIGVGFYPLMGSRVWCRFGCPMAAILGIFQRFFSRFRITTNGSQCISCGNCTVYCEMGIDVRAYAQRQENIVRASCVGCGVCAAVCPRGVLRLEGGPVTVRFEGSDNPLNDLASSLKKW